MGGFDSSVCYEFGQHGDDLQGCAWAKYDSTVQAWIGELETILDGLDENCNPSESRKTYAEGLMATLSTIEKCHLMQFFKSEWPTQPLTPQQKGELFLTMSKVCYDLAEDEDEEGGSDDGACWACRQTMICLSGAPLMTIAVVQQNWDTSQFAGEVDDEASLALKKHVEVLQDRALYIQSRATDLYFGKLAFTSD